MTPDKARELLDNATPGPWEAWDTYSNGTPRQDTSRQMRAGDQYLGIMHAPDAHLAAAAPDLAKLVAGLRYVYAVECTRDGENWRRETTWDSRSLADSDEKCFKQEDEFIDTRIVRRLVSDEEVVAGG